MSGALKVLQPGLFTTVQDLGRHGGQRFGIPVSGASDPVALRAANVVVGNPQGVAALEMALMGPTLEVVADSVRVCVAGGTTELHVLRDDGEPRRVKPLESVRVMRGEKLRVGAITGSAVAMLAIEGGIDVAPFFGSRSTYVRGAFGGLDGRALREGDLLPLAMESAPERTEVQLERLDLVPRTRIRVVLGPQDDFFSQEAVRTLLCATYTVTREADRMGLRLDGPKLTHTKGFNIVSDGIAPGAIQVPGNGLPIILLADRQSTGGYPKIATVASVDLAALGRVSPGAQLAFEAITVEAAQVLRREETAMLRGLAQALTPVRSAGPDAARLFSDNLVSGVVSAVDPVFAWA